MPPGPHTKGFTQGWIEGNTGSDYNNPYPPGSKDYQNYALAYKQGFDKSTPYTNCEHFDTCGDCKYNPGVCPTTTSPSPQPQQQRTDCKAEYYDGFGCGPNDKPWCPSGQYDNGTACIQGAPRHHTTTTIVRVISHGVSSGGNNNNNNIVVLPSKSKTIKGIQKSNTGWH